jgi:acyl-CoA synthetase (AMP-forming)/AMP-acid ligase II
MIRETPAQRTTTAQGAAPDADAAGTIGALLQARACAHGDVAALLAPQCETLSYAALWQAVELIAQRLREYPVTPRARVAVAFPSGPEAAIAILGVMSAVTCVPLNPSAAPGELRDQLRRAKAQLLVVPPVADNPATAAARVLGLPVLALGPRAGATAAPTAADHSRTDAAAPTDVALLLQTSGTTSSPKLVPLTHANLLASARSVAATLALTPADRCINVMPLFHVHGLVGALLSTLCTGGGLVATPGFDERYFLDWVESYRPTWYTAVPTIHQAIAEAARDDKRGLLRRYLRFARSSSAPLPLSTHRALEEALGVPIIEAYGMTEAAHQIASNPLPPAMRVAGSVGRAAGADIAVMSSDGRLLATGAPGELVIRGAGVTLGYDADPEATRQAFAHGWFHTGDLGWIDAAGYVFISGRLKEIVNRGGEKISPREVEDVLLEHPAVDQTAAFGVPHDSLGEDLVAAVVLKRGAPADEQTLREFVRERLAEAKVPAQIVIVDAIPRNATGKIQRTALAEQLRAQLANPFRAASTPAEHSVEAIVRAVLRCPPASMSDNFFALGGDSLTGQQVVTRINAAHGVRLSIVTLFQHPTIGALANAVTEREAHKG